MKYHHLKLKKFLINNLKSLSHQAFSACVKGFFVVLGHFWGMNYIELSISTTSVRIFLVIWV